MTFRVRPRAYRHRISYHSLKVEGVGKIIKLFNISLIYAAYNINYI